MSEGRLEHQQELGKETVISPPVVESFLSPAAAAEVWPERVVADETFLKQIQERQELREDLDAILSRLPRPDISFQTAIDQELLTQEQVQKIYNSLSKLLESEQSYKRLALYLPFEFLPDKNWKPENKELEQAKEQFSASYTQAFRGLLSMHDVRANFVDGDVLESDQQGDKYPRVVKAAHLIPKLVEKGLMTTEDVITLMKESSDPLLKESLADALPVLADMGLLSDKEIEAMSKSKDRLIRSVAKIVASGMEKAEEKETLEIPTINPEIARERLQQKFSEIDSQSFGDITEKRKKWLKEKQKQQAIETLGTDISLNIGANSLEKSFLDEKAVPEIQQALVDGIRKAVESAAQENFQVATQLYAKYQETLLALWSQGDLETIEALSKTFRHFKKLGIVNDQQLEQLNILNPKLEGPFSENLEAMKEDIARIQGMIAEVEVNPELSNMIYSAVVVFGSKLKGYGVKNADIDLAVFVKPGTSVDQQEKLQQLLQATFSLSPGEVVNEFWLDENNGSMSVHNFKDPNSPTAKKYWTHILFGGAWEGNKEDVKKLQQNLLAPYLYETSEKIEGEDARTIYLTEMERDTLQYRLMHKGYERFNPPYGGIHTKHADSIDGNSVFYDSGYRQLATKLFVDRVFLPKLPNPKS